MAKRQAILTFDTEEVQGEGSFVKLRMPLWGEIKKQRKQLREMEEADKSKFEIEDVKIGMTETMLINAIVEWDWVDEEDNPLPRPKDEPAVIERLLSNEIEFLAVKLKGEEEKKDSSDS